jgi:predicted HAD superfamily Cof-like phosphohydrolase
MNRECGRITLMNNTFELPCNLVPTDQGTLRLYEFESVLHEELSELKQARQLPEGSTDRFVAVADLLGDILVYTLSEACRWGIPIEKVFHAIMDSQDSKLVNGKPLKSPDGSKFIKGPDYQPPEPLIRSLIIRAQTPEPWNDISMATDDMLSTIPNKDELENGEWE